MLGLSPQPYPHDHHHTPLTPANHNHDHDHDPSPHKGHSFTSLGPEPCPSSGSILDDPSLVWVEDQWAEECTQQTQQRIRGQGPSLAPSQTGIRPHLLEVGCGVGNAALPLLQLDPALTVTAIDLSAQAVDILAAHPLATDRPARLRAIVCAVVAEELPIEGGSADFVLCMFVLSAIHPRHHAQVLKKLAGALRPGGPLLMRDYGRYDEAQLRFGKGSKLGDNFYVRQDGTCAFYFDKEELAPVSELDMGAAPGMRVEQCEYILRQYANRRQRVARYRVWVHGVFRREEEEGQERGAKRETR